MRPTNLQSHYHERLTIIDLTAELFLTSSYSKLYRQYMYASRMQAMKDWVGSRTSDIVHKRSALLTYYKALSTC